MLNFCTTQCRYISKQSRTFRSSTTRRRRSKDLLPSSIVAWSSDTLGSIESSLFLISISNVSRFSVFSCCTPVLPVRLRRSCVRLDTSSGREDYRLRPLLLFRFVAFSSMCFLGVTYVFEVISFLGAKRAAFFASFQRRRRRIHGTRIAPLL